jgi:hypothetical protein
MSNLIVQGEGYRSQREVLHTRWLRAVVDDDLRCYRYAFGVVYMWQTSVSIGMEHEDFRIGMMECGLGIDHPKRAERGVTASLEELLHIMYAMSQQCTNCQSGLDVLKLI